MEECKQEKVEEDLCPTIIFESKTNNLLNGVFGTFTNVQSCAKAFYDWISENEFTKKDIWYADMFSYDTKEHIGSLEIQNGEIIAVPAPDNSKVSLYHRKKGLIKTIRYTLIKIYSIFTRGKNSIDVFEDNPFDNPSDGEE